MDQIAGEAFIRGMEQSSLFRTLVSELESSDVIVHVLTTFSMPTGAIGMTRLASAAGRYRYLRITIDVDLGPEDRVATLGHELQHACEIARSGAKDTRSIRALYQQIGERVSAADEAYDTQAAIEAGSHVWLDLHQSSRRATMKAHGR